MHDDIIESREVLIRRRDTHLDQLADKLREGRVKRVIEPIVSGIPDAASFKTDDVQYVCDLGLIRQSPTIQVANPIYREIIPRELINSLDKSIPYETAWFVEDGRLVMERLMDARFRISSAGILSTGRGSSIIWRRGLSCCCRRS